MTWSNQPEISTELYETYDYDPELTNNPVLNYPTKKPITLNLTKLMNEAQNGIMLKSLDEELVSQGDFYTNFASPFNEKKDFRPQLILQYIDKKSLVSNEQYTTSVKRAGTGLLDLYTKGLIFVHHDVETRGEKMPLSIDHIYNSRYKDQRILTSSRGKQTDNLGCGLGWKLNYHQFMLPINPSEDYEEEERMPVYTYLDGSGNETVLIKRKINLKEYEMTDEKGMGLLYDETTRILSDLQGNKLYFDFKGRLIKLKNGKNAITFISYHNDLITRITDAGGQSAVLSYEMKENGFNLLKSIYSNGQLTQFIYHETQQLKNVMYPTLSIQEYWYGESGSLYDLTTIRDETGYKITYVHGSNKITIKESTNIHHIQEGNIQYGSEIEGGKVEIDFEENKTMVNQRDGSKIVYRFNELGMSYCSYVIKNLPSGYPKINALNYSGGKDKTGFSGQIPIGKKNYLINGNMDQGNGGWIFEGTASAGQGFTPLSIEGLRSYRLYGEINKAKKLYQDAVVPDGKTSFVISGFAKGESLPLEKGAKFELKGLIFYQDGTSEKEEIAEYNWQDRDWQVAMIGVSKSLENLQKQIHHIHVELNYSNNSGAVYLDDVRLVEGTYNKQKIEPQYSIKKDSYETKIEDITELCYLTEETINQGGVTIQTKENGVTKLKIEDIQMMISQIVENRKGKIILNGSVLTDQALIGEDYWSNARASIWLKGNNREYSLSEARTICENRIEGENGSPQRSKVYLNEKGQLKRSVIKDEYGKEFMDFYGYQYNQISMHNDDYRSIEMSRDFDLEGNIIYETQINSAEGDYSKRFTYEYEYDQDGNYLSKIYDERKEGFSQIKTNSSTGVTESITGPDGQKINYGYELADTLSQMSTTIGTDVSYMSYGYQRGLLTKVVSNNNQVLFDYDGFSELRNVKINGDSFVTTQSRTDGDYNSLTEDAFDFDEVIYQNGAQKTYGIKTIYEQNGSHRCTKGIYYTPEGEILSSEELTRTFYLDDERVYQTRDNGMGEGKDTEYTYYYKDDGSISKISMEGYYTGEIEGFTDSMNRSTEKHVTFGEKKEYRYNYQKIGESTYIDNRISGIFLPSSAGVGYYYDNLNRLETRNIDTG